MSRLKRFLRNWGWVVAIVNGTLYTFFNAVKHIVGVIQGPTDLVGVVIAITSLLGLVVVGLAMPDFFRFYTQIRDLLTGEKGDK